MEDANEIYISEFNQEEGVGLIISGDEHSVWAYLTNEDNEILLDGFVCSRGLLIDTNDDVRKYIEASFQPPLIREYASEFAVKTDLNADDLTIAWDEGLASVLLGDELLLEMEYPELAAFSRAVKKSGPFGNPLEGETE
ncbi:hypothetical protein FUAX_22610 [Fulvitalea axinellae]|uniref:DUF2750 domain-containing protein n=1 Tax=Fulvitalea axinellae TaxID=1182444 RepID=A0AAU9D5Q8_9BACT|nr:hypothetical protein FUAX_22610 [Fulvitalea axinellae]